jgi:hypothetical protein
MGDFRALARINHSFSMSMEPAQAQEMFVRDLAPELHKAAGFSLYKNKPGELAFGDERDLSTGSSRSEVSGWMRRLAERRIRVTFAAEPPGTRVTLKGGIERDVRRMLLKLGEPGHWPDLGS